MIRIHPNAKEVTGSPGSVEVLHMPPVEEVKDTRGIANSLIRGPETAKFGD
jgi:hypothetical protein